MKKILFLLMVVLFPQSLFAQNTQFYLEDKIAKELGVRIYLVADEKAQTQVQTSLYKAVDQARDAYQKYKKDLTGIAQKGNYRISPESATLLETALQLAKKTGGAFDIAYGPHHHNYEKIRVDKGKGEVSLRADGIQFHLENIQHGALADIIVRNLVEDGWSNCLVKIGTIFVSRGNDAYGPWKIPVMRPTDNLASHMLFYKAVGDVGAATFPKSNKQDVAIDPRKNEIVNPDIVSATIFGVDGAEAEALSAALYVMGYNGAKKFLNKNKKYRAVLGNLDGQYTHIPKFGPQSRTESAANSLPRISKLKETKQSLVEAEASPISTSTKEVVEKKEPPRVHATRDTL